MAEPADSAQDVAARDDAHLRSLGIKPELNRTLGFMANFALAFSFISVSTGSFGNFGIGLGLGGPMMFWTWLIIVAGQFNDVNPKSANFAPNPTFWISMPEPSPGIVKFGMM